MGKTLNLEFWTNASNSIAVNIWICKPGGAGETQNTHCRWVAGETAHLDGRPGIMGKDPKHMEPVASFITEKKWVWLHGSYNNHAIGSKGKAEEVFKGKHIFMGRQSSMVGRENWNLERIKRHRIFCNRKVKIMVEYIELSFRLGAPLGGAQEELY